MSIRKLQRYEKELKDAIYVLHNEMIKLKFRLRLDPTPYHLFELRCMLKNMDGLKVRLSLVSHELYYEVSKHIQFQKYVSVKTVNKNY